METIEKLRARVDRNLVVLFALILGAGCALVYGRTLFHGFFYEDFRVLVQSDGAKAFPAWRALETLGERLEKLETVVNQDQLRPFHILTLAWDYSIWGEDPSLYHGLSVLIHAANALLVFFFLFLGLESRRAPVPGSRRMHLFVAGAVAAIFAFHPLQVEPIAYLAARGILLATFFSLLALLALRFSLLESLTEEGRLIPRLSLYVAGLLAWVVAIPFKEEALLVPAILALYDFSVIDPILGGKRNWKTRGLFYAPLVFTAFLVLLFRWTLFHGTWDPGAKPGAYEPLATHAVAYWEYFRLLLFPVGLSVDHGFPAWQGFSPGPLLALAAHGAVFFLLFLLVRSSKELGTEGKIRRRVAAACAAGIYLSLLPSTGCVPLVLPVAEHRTYLAVLFWAGLAVAGGTELLAWIARSRWNSLSSRRAQGAALSGVVFLFAVISFARTGLWGSGTELWADAVRKNPGNAVAHYHLGASLLAERRGGEAMREFGETLRLDKTFYLAAANRGVLFMEEGDFVNAELNFLRVLALRPDHVPTMYNLAVLYERDNAPKEAIRMIRRALVYRPEDAAFLEKEGDVLAALKETDGALVAYGKSLGSSAKETPTLAIVQNRQAILHRMAFLAFDAGLKEEAEKRFRQAVSEDPRDATNWLNLAVFLEKTDRAEDAIQTYRRALLVDPAFGLAHFNLAKLYEAKKECGLAESRYRVAASYDPRYKAEYQAYLDGTLKGTRCKP
ncbi:MAG: tetratricopeptide repeat protein [Bdellovibrionota bacterium]